jgi:hypothetical protein
MSVATRQHPGGLERAEAAIQPKTAQGAGPHLAATARAWAMAGADMVGSVDAEAEQTQTEGKPQCFSGEALAPGRSAQRGRATNGVAFA